jgi:type IV secretory pathway TrbD component
MAVVGGQSCWLGSTGTSGIWDERTSSQVNGCRGCLRTIVVLTLMACSIVGLVLALGGVGVPTAGLAVMALGLAAIHVRGRSHPRPRPGLPIPLRGAGLRAEQSPAMQVGRRPLRVPAEPGEPDRAKLCSSLRPRSGLTERPVRRARDPLPARVRFSVLQRDGFRCTYCGRPGNEPGVVLHIDHVVPIVAGGSSTEDNLVTACERCNLGKGTRAVVAR